MPDDREHRRRYGDKEVGLILKRAADLQKQEPTSAAEGGGLTLAELEEIAGEAGIDARYLRAAAAELDSGAGHGEEAALFLGAPLKVEFERTLAGELPESEFERLLPEIQKAAAGYGQASIVGRVFTWQSQNNDAERVMLVTVSVRDGRTRIRIEERYSNLAGQLFGGFLAGGGGGVGLGVGLGVGIGALSSLLFTIAFPLAAFGASYWLARSIFSRSVAKRQRVLRELLDRITDQVLAAMGIDHIEEPKRAPRLPSS